MGIGYNSSTLYRLKKIAKNVCLILTGVEVGRDYNNKMICIFQCHSVWYIYFFYLSSYLIILPVSPAIFVRDNKKKTFLSIGTLLFSVTRCHSDNMKIKMFG